MLFNFVTALYCDNASDNHRGQELRPGKGMVLGITPTVLEESGMKIKIETDW